LIQEALLHYDGLKKVLRGLTTLEEVERVTPEETGLAV
jgi:type II secretory ATPase GspE/PulE/Tfp pilus assembly ATPase PilB-like protein